MVMLQMVWGGPAGAGQQFHQAVEGNSCADFGFIGPRTGSQGCMTAVHNNLWFAAKRALWFTKQSSLVFDLLISSRLLGFVCFSLFLLGVY